MRIDTFDSRARERFTNLVWHAAYNARDGREALHIAAVVTAVDTGQLTLRDAHDCIAELRSQQRTQPNAA